MKQAVLPTEVRPHQPLLPCRDLSSNALESFVRNANQFGPFSQDYLVSHLPAYIGLRRAGRHVLSKWIQNTPLFSLLKGVILSNEIDAIELSFTTAMHQIEPPEWRKHLTNRQCGRVGLEIVYNGRSARISPSQTIAANKPLARWFEDWLADAKITQEGLVRTGGKLFILEMRQFLMLLGDEPRCIETFRGNRVVAPEEVNGDLLDSVIRGMGQWLMSNMSVTGDLPYKYWPSRGVESTADNPIRRFLATIALNRLALARDDEAILHAAQTNLAYNLSRFYRSDGDLGHIDWGGTVKLGAVALAALAILESPSRDQWPAEYLALTRTVEHLWRPDGSFRTFLLPADRNDNQNFYPGEALLLWASVLERHPEPRLMERALKSIDFYKAQFRDKPNPAFVPWHTQAAAIIARLTSSKDLHDYIFEMNDWLVPHQQWGGTLDPDLWGRFYSPHRPDYGPPHASSTGVYLEGLADALRLACELHDIQRIESYKRVILKGLRSLAQLQFKEWIDCFYVSKPSRVMGGIRTECYNNEIRVDNIQHALMGLLKLQQLMEMEPYGSYISPLKLK